MNSHHRTRLPRHFRHSALAALGKVSSGTVAMTRNPALAAAAATFGLALATTAAIVGTNPQDTPQVSSDARASISALISSMSPAGSIRQEIRATPKPVQAQRQAEQLGRLSDDDALRLAILRRPVPSDTPAAARLARTMPIPKNLSLEQPSAEQAQVLEFGVFAPIASRVFNNATQKMETHWALHPWDVVRLAERASAEVYLEKNVRVDPKIIGAAYYAESAGVVQQGWDRQGMEQLAKGRSMDQVARTPAKASFGLFQLDERHGEQARDIDPVASAKRAALMLAEGEANMRAHPALGMLAISATYNASSNLRKKIFNGAPLTERESESLAMIERHSANMSYGAALYANASSTYHQHLKQVQKMGIPLMVDASSVQRNEPLVQQRAEAVNALTRQTGAVRNPAPAYAPDNNVLPSPQNQVRLRDGSVFMAAAALPKESPARVNTIHPTIQQIEATARAAAPVPTPTTVAEALRQRATIAQLSSEAADRAMRTNRERGEAAQIRLTEATNALTSRAVEKTRIQALIDRNASLDLAPPLERLAETARDKARRNEMLAGTAESVEATTDRMKAGLAGARETLRAGVRDWKNSMGSMLSRVSAVHREREGYRAAGERQGV